MSFYCEFKTLRVGNSYDLKTQSKMSTHGEGNTGEVGTRVTEGGKESNIELSTDLLDDRIKASLEPLHAQISALTKMMDRLIQGSFTTEITTAGTRGLVLQHESTYSEVPGSSQFPTLAPLATAGYSPNMVTGATQSTHCWPPPPLHADVDTDDKDVFPSGNKGRILANTRRDRAVWKHHPCNHNAAE